MLLLLAALLTGCGLPACDNLCRARAACVADTIDENGSTWQDWTGYASQDDYESACFDEFSASVDAGADVDDVNKLCDGELGAACGG